jgi:hypothetical protein
MIVVSPESQCRQLIDSVVRFKELLMRTGAPSDVELIDMTRPSKFGTKMMIY